MEITEWLKDKHKDYETGVKLYAESSAVKTRTLATLQRGKNPRNLAVLIKELRQLSKKKGYQPPKGEQKTIPASKSKKPQSVLQPEKEELIQKSSQSYFQKVKYGDLPAELRPRFKRIREVWFEMCDLKFDLNAIPADKENQALEIILQIEALDEEKEMIWREIDHWKLHKTILPTKTEEDFTGLTGQQLYLKKANLVNYINKKQKRIEAWENAIKKEDKQERLKVEQQINRTKKAVHRHQLDLKKIEELL